MLTLHYEVQGSIPKPHKRLCDGANPSTWEVEAEGSDPQHRPWSHSEFEASLGCLRPD